jgi:hypothetical protein
VWPYRCGVDSGGTITEPEPLSLYVTALQLSHLVDIDLEEADYRLKFG